MSGQWLKAVREREDAEVVALVDLNLDAAKARAQEFLLPDAVIARDLGKTLAKTGADVVFDCTIPAAHVKVVLTALKHRCHVLGEKPLADSMTNARKMIAAAQQARRTYAVVQNYRFQPAVRRLRAFIESGAIGRVNTINSDFYVGAHFGGFREQMKHVLLLDMAIHTFDMARLFSGVAPLSVQCHEWNPEGSWFQHGASAAAVFEMERGIVYNYRGSWCAEGMTTSWNGRWHIFGDEGNVRWDGGSGFDAEVVEETSGLVRKMRRIEVPAGDHPGRVDGHKGVIFDFLDSVQARRKPETICTDNVKSLAMVFAAIESATKRRPVKIKP